jgi:hypothetical protein
MSSGQHARRVQHDWGSRRDRAFFLPHESPPAKAPAVVLAARRDAWQLRVPLRFARAARRARTARRLQERHRAFCPRLSRYRGAPSTTATPHRAREEPRHLKQIPEASSESIELPDHKRIAGDDLRFMARCAVSSCSTPLALAAFARSMIATPAGIDAMENSSNTNRAFCGITTVPSRASSTSARAWFTDWMPLLALSSSAAFCAVANPRVSRPVISASSRWISWRTVFPTPASPSQTAKRYFSLASRSRPAGAR